MAKVAQTAGERREYMRLKRVFKELPPNEFAAVEGLIREAARLRDRLDTLWQDLQENGETEMFSQSPNTDPYERERPASRTYTATNKNYQAIIRQLVDRIPGSETKDALAEFFES